MVAIQEQQDTLDVAPVRWSLLGPPPSDTVSPKQQYSTFARIQGDAPLEFDKAGTTQRADNGSTNSLTTGMLAPIRQIFSSSQTLKTEDRTQADSLQQTSDRTRGSLADQPPQRGSGTMSTEHKEKPRMGALPRPVGGNAKMGTFTGVFVPTSLNVLSILMFLRFGFILGQAGVLGMMGTWGLSIYQVWAELTLIAMLVVCYLINLVTTLSISAIATNGTVRGGGAYYLISRSLGPEFGGSIGIVFYLGFAFNTGLNAVGLIDCFVQNFGTHTGNWANWLQEDYWSKYLWSSCVLLLCTAICLAGSGIFARCSNGLLVLLLVATFSIPFSALMAKPFTSVPGDIVYTGPSFATFKGNFMPHFTHGAAGSQLKGRETYQDLFGILFPATGGIFAFVEPISSVFACV